MNVDVNVDVTIGSLGAQNSEVVWTLVLAFGSSVVPVVQLTEVPMEFLLGSLVDFFGCSVLTIDCHDGQSSGMTFPSCAVFQWVRILSFLPLYLCE
jgi:hypothetical protein